MPTKGKVAPKPKKPDEGEKALKTPLNIWRRPIKVPHMERIRG